MKIQNLPLKFSVKTKQLRAQGAPSARTGKFSHQFLRQNKAVKNLKKSAKLKIIEQIQELSIVTSCTFSSNLRRWRTKRRTWVLTRNETRFLSLWFCFSCLTLITRFSRCSLLYIFFLWSETVTYDTRVSRTVSRRGP